MLTNKSVFRKDSLREDFQNTPPHVFYAPFRHAARATFPREGEGFCKRLSYFKRNPHPPRKLGTLSDRRRSLLYALATKSPLGTFV